MLKRSGEAKPNSFFKYFTSYLLMLSNQFKRNMSTNISRLLKAAENAEEKIADVKNWVSF